MGSVKACTIMVALLAAVATLPAYGAERIALVIGNAAYTKAPALQNTRNDAQAVAASLERLGFEVILVVDADQTASLEALDRFARAMREAEAAIFYYSGHGIQVNGQNYLLPVDADVLSERSLRYGAVNVADVVHDMERTVPVSLVILDACRDNPFTETLQGSLPASRSAAVTRGLALIRPQSSGTIIAYAAAAGATASDGSDGHSPYTQALLSELETTDVEVGLVFRRVAGKVVEATRGEQRPELLVRLSSEFYLNRSAAAATVAAPAPQEPAAAPAPEPAATGAIPAFVGAGGTGADLYRGWESAGLLPAPEPLFEPGAVWSPPAGAALDEAEPNNSFGTAQAVDANDRITARISPRRDADWYRVEIGHGGELHVVVAGPPPTLDLQVRLYDAEKNAVSGPVGAARNGAELAAVFDVAAPGEYWLEVTDARNDGEADEPFELALAFGSQPDRFEPNDSFGTARTVPLEGEIVANILPARDADWFRLQTRVPGVLSVTATSVADNLDISFRVHDQNGSALGNWAVPTRPGGDTQAVFDLPAPGDYRLEVIDTNNDQRSIEPFLLTTAFRASNDRFEPNDTVGRAAPLTLDTIQRITVFPQRDVDWLSIDIDQPGELQFMVSQVPPGLDIQVRVHDQDKKVVRNWVAPARMGEDTVGFADLAQPGRYYLEIADGRNDASSIEPVRLETRFVPTADQYEPNDTFGHATPISTGGEIAFNILPLRDVDWFQLRVAEPGELAIVIDKGPEDLDITLRVWTAERRTLTGWFEPEGMGGRTEGIVDLPAPGVYFIEVADGRGDGRSIHHATLRTMFTATGGGVEPNDTFGSATEVALEGETQAHILPLRDTDWHRFHADRPGDLTIAVTQVDEALDVQVRLYTAERRSLGGWVGPEAGPGGDTLATYSIDEPGWYWLEIADGRSDGRSATPFTVRRTFTPSPQ